MAERTTFNAIWRLSLLLASLGLSLTGRAAGGQECKPPSPTMKQTVTSYVHKQYEVPEAANLRITDETHLVQKPPVTSGA
jgi:hypothetical protein